MVTKIDNINTEILRLSREQIGLSLEEVSKKIKNISDIEEGIKKPTIKQIDTLANLYNVPRWIFICEIMPKSYQFSKSMPAFRQFADSNRDIFNDYKVRGLTTKVERFRELVIDFYEDLDEELPLFQPPKMEQASLAEQSAVLIRQWLNIKDEDVYSFEEWKVKLEEKGIFLFITSKYKGWSHIDKEVFRGLAIYHSVLPIIIINDSDANKAQSFTLFHELGHLIKNESSVDEWSSYQTQSEKWYDDFSGNCLMPAQQFNKEDIIINNLDDIKFKSRAYKVSSYAFLVRLRQLNIINQVDYEKFETQLKEEYRNATEKMKKSHGGPVRNRPNELLNQYGHIYSRAVFQAYHNKIIGLQKLCKLFDLKNPSYALELEGKI